jgi:hypothetical protein
MGRYTEASVGPASDDDRLYVPHLCPVCGRIHLINRVSGKLLVESARDPDEC